MKQIAHILLYPFYLLYFMLMRTRNLLYDKKLLEATKLDCKVISIGNISMGGTGKTPAVIALAKELKQKYKVAVLSRGYGRKSRGLQLVSDGNQITKDWKTVGDEPFLIMKHLPDIPIVVDENRVRGGQYLVNKFNPDIIILDDAFQHRKIRRDLDIVIIAYSKNSSWRFLREPLGSLKRADFILLTSMTANQNYNTREERLSKFKTPLIPLAKTADKILVNFNQHKIETEAIRGKAVIIFSGIGNPDSFTKTVEGLGCKILKILTFKDHHFHTDSDTDKIKSHFDRLKPDYVLTTEKDLVKLPPTKLPLLAVTISVKIPPQILNHINKMME